MPPPGVKQPPKRTNIDRFIYYFAGVAIGCVFAGIIIQSRKAAAGSGGGPGTPGSGIAAPPPEVAPPKGSTPAPPANPAPASGSATAKPPQTTP